MPVTVAAWGIAQSAAVNVKLAGVTVPSAGSLDTSSIVTSAAG